MKVKVCIALLGVFLFVSACGGFVQPDRIELPEGESRFTPEIVQAEPKIEMTADGQGYLNRKEADSQEPAAGVCMEAGGEVATIEIGIVSPPSPRCLIVSSDSYLNFKNMTGNVVEIEVGGSLYRLGPGKEGAIDRRAGEYLELGVHRIRVKEGFLPEIWVK